MVTSETTCNDSDVLFRQISVRDAQIFCSPSRARSLLEDSQGKFEITQMFVTLILNRCIKVFVSPNHDDSLDGKEHANFRSS